MLLWLYHIGIEESAKRKCVRHQERQAHPGQVLPSLVCLRTLKALSIRLFQKQTIGFANRRNHLCANERVGRQEYQMIQANLELSNLCCHAWLIYRHGINALRIAFLRILKGRRWRRHDYSSATYVLVYYGRTVLCAGRGRKKVGTPICTVCSVTLPSDSNKRGATGESWR